MPEKRRIPLSDVPPPSTGGNCEKVGEFTVIDDGVHRWRLDAKGNVVTYIEYFPRDDWDKIIGVPWKRLYHA